MTARPQQVFKKSMLSGVDNNGDPIDHWCELDSKDQHSGFCLICHESVAVGLRGRDALVRHSGKTNHIQVARKSRNNEGKLRKLTSYRTCSWSLTCIDEEGNPVDWYIVYKLPEISDNNCLDVGLDPGCEERIKEGTAYLYMDVNNPNFYMPAKDVNDSTNAFYRTLEPVYQNYQNPNGTIIGRGFYNDEYPNGDWTSYYGHTKGAYAFDSKEGFWLTHSVPKFPNWIAGGYSYPSSGTYYGQQMMCISLNVSQFDTLGTHFLYTNPWNYDVSIPAETFGDVVPNLISATVDYNHVEEAPWTANEEIVSLGGVKFVLFSKYKKADLDMVSQFMAPGLESDLYSQTWQNEGTNLPSDCTDKYWTFTVKEFKMATFGVEFKNSKDHSKWAVGAPDQFTYSTDWVCVGDMNRQESQEDRSGGYACFRQGTVQQQYTAFSAEIVNCPHMRPGLI